LRKVATVTKIEQRSVSESKLAQLRKCDTPHVTPISVLFEDSLLLRILNLRTNRLCSAKRISGPWVTPFSLDALFDVSTYRIRPLSLLVLNFSWHCHSHWQSRSNLSVLNCTILSMGYTSRSRTTVTQNDRTDLYILPHSSSDTEPMPFTHKRANRQSTR
jgi:hypothetical protein